MMLPQQSDGCCVISTKPCNLLDKREKRKALKYVCSRRDDRATVSPLTVKRTAIGETVFKRNNLSLLTTCVSRNVTKSMPLERIDERRGRLRIDTESLFLLYHSGLQSFVLTHYKSWPRPAPCLMLKGGVNAEGGVETLQITALSGSVDKVQATDSHAHCNYCPRVCC